MADQTVPTTKEKLEVIGKIGGHAPATLSEADLNKELPEKAGAPSDGAPTYTCVTQLNAPRSSPAAVMVGLFETIPRWKLGSVINFATYSEGFPAPGDAVYAAKALIQAADEWNAAKVGVTFKWVPNLEDAAFVLAYGGHRDRVLASAFFPSASPLETLWVYDAAFEKTEQKSERGPYTHYGIMKNVFLHELGHVLGLRHEFAMDPERFEGGAVVMGTRNPESVMEYKFPPMIQKTDIDDTRYFYKFPLIVDYNPDN